MSNLSQFSLRWNDYVQHVTEAFHALRTQDDLVDVTLCCEGRKIKAHKVLLSACSVYFREIFKENPCQHPIVIFRNVKFDDLNAIVHFMYHGEVNILQEQIESFLITAELLEVKGLTDDSEKEEISDPVTAHSYIDFNSSTQLHRGDLDVQGIHEEPMNLARAQPSKSNNSLIPNILSTPELSQPSTRYDNSVNEQDSSVKPLETSSTASVTLTQISEDMQVDNQNNDHNEDPSERNISNESDLGMFRCQLCPKGFKHPTSLTLHKDSHTGKTQCPVCHRSFSRSYDMRSHLQKIHQGNHLTIKEIRYKVANDTMATKTFTHHI